MNFNKSIFMIQDWWKSISSNRCRKCGDITNTTIFMCQECYMDRHCDEETLERVAMEQDEARAKRVLQKQKLGIL